MRQSSAALHHAQHASIDCAAEQDYDDRLDPDDPDQEPTQAELNEAEIAINLQKQKERDLDFFAPIFDKAITSHAHGEISGMARYLLKNVCRQCVMNITAIPDYRYYSCWMNNNAIECDEINRLYRAVITTSDQLNKQEMASLFSSYLQLESNDMSINATNGETNLTAPVPYDRDNPIRNFPKAKSQIETACVCTNIDLFRALLIVFIRNVWSLPRCLKTPRHLACSRKTKSFSQPPSKQATRDNFDYSMSSCRQSSALAKLLYTQPKTLARKRNGPKARRAFEWNKAHEQRPLYAGVS